MARFRRGGDPAATAATGAGTGSRTAVAEHEHAAGGTAVAPAARTHGTEVHRRDAEHPGLDRDTMQHARARQRERFGGFNWGAAFFGWLVAVGMAALLTALLAATGAAIGLTTSAEAEAAAGGAETLTVAGAIALVAVLCVAYACGGYVAGRMSRFDGARQGFGAWIFGIVVTVALAVLAVVAGSEYNVLEQLNLPRLPIGEAELRTGGLIATAAILLGTLLAAVLGGKAGERYHRRVDRAAIG